MSAATMHAGLAGGGELRLTPRGRRVVSGIAALIAGAALLTGGRAVAESPTPAVSVDSYTVGSGETLWSIASAFTAPGEDVRDTVDEIAELNGMAGSGLVAGDQILVPVGR
jgi:nucleoid-associated protein YgaU